MFAAKTSAILIWNRQLESHTEDATRSASVVLSQNIRLPFDTSLQTEAQYQTSIHCGPIEMAYTISGGAPRPGAQVSASTSAGLKDTIRLRSTSSPAAQLVLDLSVNSTGSGDLQAKAGTFQFNCNGESHNVEQVPGSAPVRITLKTPLENQDSVWLEVDFADQVFFASGESGNLSRTIEISRVSFEDAQGNSIQFGYTTDSGQRYNVPPGNEFGEARGAGA